MAMSQDVTTAAYVHGEQEECEEVERSAEPGKWSQVKGTIQWASSRAWDGIEFVGEALIDMIGLNDSRYQWAIDEHFKQKELEEEARRCEQLADAELNSSSAA
mmetsp:Transcript_9896/g.15665  ORF Transcript_9896/g.15665 Transcript_9896/m.15665 type:complete len:103 (+) Transcript_9896:33-341(+)